jgi:ubiquinone/menaquinone biosynthesis C-methylase UbiE
VSAEDWEREAGNWIAWARTPGHDIYVAYRDAFFDLVPEPGRATLEIGCGEGRVARDLAACGHRVTGLDVAPSMVRSAQLADPHGEYVLGDAARLPFADGSFDLVVAYNSLMDVDDMPAAVSEAARVLEPGGRLCVCVLHPMADAGRFTERTPQAPFLISGSYLEDRVPWYRGKTFERDGLRITFASYRYSLEQYARALEEAGFAIEALREPPARDVEAERDPPKGRWQRLPCFLMLRARVRSCGSD